MNGALALADGARLLATEQGVAVDVDGRTVLTIDGALSSAPVVAADGRRAWLAATPPRGLDAKLVALARVPGGWQARTLIDGTHTITRLALDPTGNRLAFVWPGPKGGVSALYLLDLADPASVPQRLTNRAARVPGQPPADFIPLPLRGPPRFAGDTLLWSAEDGEHTLRVGP